MERHVQLLIFSHDKICDFGDVGPTGYINKELIEKNVPPASQGDKVKIFVCGMLSFQLRVSQYTKHPPRPTRSSSISGREESWHETGRDRRHSEGYGI